MISENKVLKEVKWLEKEVEGMTHHTRQGFLKVIAEFKSRLEAADELEVYEFMKGE